MTFGGLAANGFANRGLDGLSELVAHALGVLTQTN
jgi:hypothetical protein